MHCNPPSGGHVRSLRRAPSETEGAGALTLPQTSWAAPHELEDVDGLWQFPGTGCVRSIGAATRDVGLMQLADEEPATRMS